ncbi:nucleotidyl transferase AbiEii/AbiGii toxin family protein [Actinoplanes sp. CA-051413]|uniref:nucleotidyl transferase AbiEii/AbiGii toxin family protein n=1 Tax=Actinoplanes sp. CA-051413 TaxID=3239899 RepID=UPI003D989527
MDRQNLARRQGRPTQTLTVIYILERLLARLEVSGYADRFVLKGGMLLAAWDARRATVDDVIAFADPALASEVASRAVWTALSARWNG